MCSWGPLRAVRRYQWPWLLRPHARYLSSNTTLHHQHYNYQHMVNVDQCKDSPSFPSLVSLLAYGTAVLIVGVGYLFKQLQQLNDTIDSMIPNVVKHDKPVYLFSATSVSENVKQKEKNLHKKTKLTFRKRKDWFAWLRFHGHNIFAIIQLTRAENPKARRFAIEALASIHSWPWTNAEYQMLAQALDRKAVVALANTPQCDARFILPPPALPPTQYTLQHELKQLLAALPKKGLDQCAEYFVDMALHKKHDKSHKEGGQEELMWSMDGSGRELLLATHPTEPSSSHVVMRYLHALLGHSKLKAHCVNMINQKAMVVLRRVYEEEKDHDQILCTLGKILANLTYHEELHEDIYRAGWVSVFAAWMRGHNMALKLQASKALNNMDTEQERPGHFQDGVYVYHPQQRTHMHMYADVVFVHGLLGGPVYTWRQIIDPDRMKQPDNATDDNSLLDVTDADQLELPCEKSKCWPQDWLAKDCPHVRILTIEYDTHLSDWAPKCPYGKEKRTLYARSKEFLDKLHEAGIGQRPVVWVGHSMGGLLIKNMLLLAEENPTFHNLVERTRGIVFFSTPHKGSGLAALSKKNKLLFNPSIEVTELAEGAAHLSVLHENFKHLVFHNKIPVLSFGEGQPLTVFNIKQVLIVPPESSDPGLGTFHLMPNLNHLTICKPYSRESLIYTLTLDFIFSCLPHLAMDNVLKVDLLDENILPEEIT